MDKIFDHVIYSVSICFLIVWVIGFSWQVTCIYIPLMMNTTSFEEDVFIVLSQTRNSDPENGVFDYSIRGYRDSDGAEVTFNWREGTIANRRYGVWNEGDTIPIWSSSMVPAKYMIERDSKIIPPSAFNEFTSNMIWQIGFIIGGLVILPWTIKKYRKILQGKDE